VPLYAGFDAGAAMIVAAHDPNWFYSTLAQSTAAIVGLAGGFIAARLTTHRAEIAQTREPLKGEFDMIAARAAGYLGTIDSMRQQLRDFLQDVDSTQAVKKDVTLPLTDRLPNLSRRGSSAPGSAPLTQDQRDRLDGFAEVIEGLYRVLQAMTPQHMAERLRNGQELRAPEEPWLDEDPGILPDQPATYWDDLELQRPYAQLWYQEIRGMHSALIPRVRALTSRLVPRTFLFLLIDLTVLLAVGTIAPMAYLSARSATTKTIFLLAFAVCALGVAVILLLEMVQIRKAGDLSRDSF
jgi:hypothetical protein